MGERILPYTRIGRLRHSEGKQRFLTEISLGTHSTLDLKRPSVNSGQYPEYGLESHSTVASIDHLDTLPAITGLAASGLA